MTYNETTFNKNFLLFLIFVKAFRPITSHRKPITVPMSLLLFLPLLKLFVLLFNIIFVWLNGVGGQIDSNQDFLFSKGVKLSVEFLFLGEIVRPFFFGKLLISFL
jgi:hypothetical protein